MLWLLIISLKKITNAKISCLAFDIHKSKLAFAECHSIKVSKTYNCLVFSINSGSNTLEFFFLGRKNNFRTQMHTKFF
jgi:hypothetical protein